MNSFPTSQVATPGIAPSSLQREDIARRIPHQLSMCLLDRVTSWDAQKICCETDSHRSPDNPMRSHGRLGSACGIEYAAQAMAVHGALIAESRGNTSAIGGAQARGGYLVSVRSVTLFAVQLDTVAGCLTVTAERVSGDANTVLYSFELLGGAHRLLCGRAIVVLDSQEASAGPAAARIPS